MPSAEFNQAYKVKYKGTPSNDELLEVYALAKIAQGEEPKKPGTFDLTGKAKYKKWEELKNSGLTAEQADAQYVAKVKELSEKYGVA